MDNSLSRGDDPSENIRFVRRLFSEINTAIPAEIIAYDSTQQIATLVPCIKAIFISNQKKRTSVTLPQIATVPVWFPYSTTTGFSLTYPVKKGDQVLVIFSQRGLDNWLKFGSIQNPPEEEIIPRNHDYTDAIALAGLIPNVNAIQDFQMDGIEIRNKNRKTFVKVTDEQVTVFCDTDSKAVFTADKVEINCKNSHFLQVENLTTVTVGQNSTITVDAAGTATFTHGGTVLTMTAGQASLSTGSTQVPGTILLNTGGNSNAPGNVNIIGNLNVSEGATGTITATTIATVVNGIVTEIQ